MGVTMNSDEKSVSDGVSDGVTPKAHSRMAKWKRVTLTTTFALASCTALIGVAHTKAARPLLMAVQRSVGGCPLGFDRTATPIERDAVQLNFSRTHHGEAEAAQRPAFGFTLDGTSREDVLSWAKHNHVACNVPKRGPDLECLDVALPADGSGDAKATIWLTFGSSGKLNAVSVRSRAMTPAVISKRFEDVKRTVTESAGSPYETRGNGTEAELTRGLLAQSSAEFRFRNYYALTRATNVSQGFLLTEEYRSLVD